MGEGASTDAVPNPHPTRGELLPPEETYEGFPCRDEFTLISDSCEGGYGFCQVTEGTFDFDEPSQFCTMRQHNCLDDHAYEDGMRHRCGRPQHRVHLRDRWRSYSVLVRRGQCRLPERPFP